MSSADHSEDRLSPAEIARLGEKLYERVRARLEAESPGKFAAVDVRTGDYGVGETVLMAVNDLRSRRPDPEAWIVRIGADTVYRIGAWQLQKV